jgi:hypothetical protein
MKNLLDIPVVESAAGGAAGSLAAGGLAGAGYRLFTPYEYRDPAYLKRVQTAAALLGAVAGAANPFFRDADYTSIPAFLKSMAGLHRAYTEDLDLEPFRNKVDVPRAMGVVQDDAFLRPYEKYDTLRLLHDSDRASYDDNKTSQYGLFKSALKAGVSYVPAYAFGRLAGQALGVPENTAKQLSTLGALAYAVRASGISEQL